MARYKPYAIASACLERAQREIDRAMSCCTERDNHENWMMHYHQTEHTLRSWRLKLEEAIRLRDLPGQRTIQ